MTDIKLNVQTGDLDLTNSALSIVDDTMLEALRQKIQIAILLGKGEWFVNINDGVPYVTDFVVLKNNRNFIDTFMRSYIRQIVGVDNLVSYSSSVDNATRKMAITFTVNSNNNEVLVIEDLEI